MSDDGISTQTLLDLSTAAQALLDLSTDNEDELPGAKRVCFQTPDAVGQDEASRVQLPEEKKQEGKVCKLRNRMPTIKEVFAVRNCKRAVAEETLKCSRAYLTTLLRKYEIDDWRKLRFLELLQLLHTTPQPAAQVKELEELPPDAWTFDNEDPNTPPTSIKAVERRLEYASLMKWIKDIPKQRIKQLGELLSRLEENGIVSFETPEHDTSTKRPSTKACILGWSTLNVSSPMSLNIEARAMVNADKDGVWKHANGKSNKLLKNPTWGVAELFRCMGVKPFLRGDPNAPEYNPGTMDRIYHRRYKFINDESFRDARKLMQPNFRRNPEEGGRERKRTRRDEPVVRVAGTQHANGPTGVSSQAIATGDAGGASGGDAAC